MNLSKYLEPMKNLPDRFSNLAFWRGVRQLRGEIIKTFENVESWGTSVENNLTSLDGKISNLSSGLSSIGSIASQAQSNAMSAIGRINKAFASHVVDITSNVAPTIYPYTVTESQVPYPRVEQCIMRFDGLSASGITSQDIIESAYFTGTVTADGNRIEFAQPIPLIPYYNGSAISFISPPISFYKTKSSMSISNVNIAIKVRCRRIPS